MAEFKLGRIRFVYQGEWTTGQSYVVDDVVSIGGKSWICVVSHTASALFATDQTYNPTKWNLLADGTRWRGDWAPSTYYDIGNMVKYGGTVYVCNEAHSSATYTSPTYLGLENSIDKWDVFASSFDWKGDWAYDTRYKENDTVVYGGTTYICNTPHISSANTSTLAVTGLTNTGTEVTLTFTAQTLPPFVIGSTVAIAAIDPAGYNDASAVVTACTTTSVTYANTTIDSYSSGGTITGTTNFGLEKDQSKWDYFNQGVTYLGDWTDFERYRINDVVKYGASTWICTTAHDSKATFEDSKWSIFVEGLQFESSWDNATTYQIGDTVTYGGYSYIAKQNHSNQNPSTATAYWDVYTTGFNFRSDWTSTTAYKVGDVIRFGGYTYLAQVDNTNQVPPNLTYWTRLNSGTSFRDIVTSYTGLSGTVLTGAGIDATFDISRSGTIYTVIVNNGGSGFTAGDTIKVLGSAIGGLSPVNDLVITVESEVSGVIDTVTITGFSSTWAHPVEYVLGDLVFFGASTYICVQGHTSNAGNRPDTDTTATYWNLFSAGAEASVLTTAGDTYYFGAQGPTRLPIGQDGQLLRVKGGYPTWAYYGVINNLVYVAPSGTDSEESGWGQTVDKPWKSVRYAADQINAGYLNRNAKALLEKNKLFMMREVSNWITYTYSVDISAADSSTDRFTCNDTTNLTANMPIEFTNTTGGVVVGTKYFVKEVTSSTTFTISDTQGGALKQLTTGSTAMIGTLSYDHVFCERDTGYLVDALVYDISHGGNSYSTNAAKAYYTTAGNAYINSNFGQQITQTVAAYNYLKELAVRVLANDAPDVNYQYENGASDMVEQIADASLVAEEGTDTLAQALLTIVTDGITAASASAIPAAVHPNTTVSVKTGTYFEVLPITIPNYTAVVGDELRGTVINPQPAIANLVNDKTKTISALNRIKSVVSDLVQNNDITVTSGNTETQQYLGGYKGNALVTTEVEAKTTDMTTVLNGGLGAVPTVTISDPTNYDTGYFNARRLIVANKAFIASEVSAWIDAQIAGNVAPFVGFVYAGAGRTKCERDVGYIVDALQYDLTYGGNFETVVAARSYYSFGVFVETGEKLQALAVQARLKDIIDNIATGNTAGWTKTTSSTQDVSGTAGSPAAAAFAQARIQEMYDTIDTGNSPEIIAPSTSWVSSDLVSAFTAIQAKKSRIQTGVIGHINTLYPTLVYDTAVCARDVAYIVDAIAYDVMFDSNFRSVKAAMSYYRGTASAQLVIADQLPATLDTITFIKDAIAQVTDGTTGSVGSLVAAPRVITAADALYNVLNNGIDSAPTELITDPPALAVGYSNARLQIANNYDFIKADVSQYIINNYNSVWTALGATGQAKCQRDVGYILDAIRYDLTYGGNTQTLIVGSSYYSYINLVIASTELTATLAAYTHLKSIIDEVAQRLTSGPTAGNTTPQVVSGTGGTLAAAQFAQARVQDIIDWITNGTAPTAIAPDTSWVATDLVASWTELQTRRTEIQRDGTGYVHKFFQELSFVEATCERDIGYMVDAIGYDMLFNSNFASVIAAKSYYRALTSTQLVLAEQKPASLGLVNFLKYKIKSVVSNGGAAKVHSTIDDIVSAINGGKVPKFLWPSYTGIDAENYAAAKLIWENKEFIKAETIAYIAANYPLIEYSEAACARDVGYIVDAVRYDMTYGGNTATRQAALAYYSQLTDLLQIDSGDLTATLAAYDNLKTIIQDIADGGLSSYSALQVDVDYIDGTGGDATSASTVGTLIQDMIDYIDDPVANPITETLAGTSWVDPNLVTQYNLLQSNRTSVRNSIITWIGANYPNLVYDSVTCSRDVGLIIDAIGYDLMFGSNYRTIKAAMSYYQAQAAVVIASQKRPTLQAMRELKGLISDLLVGNAVGHLSAWNNMNTLISILDNGVGDTPEVVGTMSYLNNSGVIASAEILRANKTFLENESTAWIRSQFGGVVSGTSGNTLTTVTSHNLSVGDPVEFMNDITNTFITAVASTGNLITLRDASKVQPGMTVTLGGGTIGNLTVSGSYFVLTVDTGTNQITVSDTYNGTVVDPGTATSPLVSVTVGSIWGGVQSGIQYYVATTPTTKTFTITEEPDSITPVSLTTTSGYMKASYAFNETACRRDMGAYIDALVYDLQYPGNYKSLMAALVYNNAVSGSERSDMFWVSNSTGLRNCTLRGLTGDLTDANIYGTKRPTAGAFVALNPGFGPRDSNVWVKARSHYSQNVTMFGSGCTGAKIDSSLHSGGNKSMVKNDFTTIISDGIGVWCTGSDSLTELVSVFNYYGYSGYLAELGGRIRATNGNSSYGTYGVIAEGVSSKETPLYGNLDNRAAQAQVTNTVTDAVMEVLRMEFGNAGTGYTNVDYTINGAGYNAAAIGDEFRDGAVFETRIIDLNDGNGVGGSEYETASNAAQEGGVGFITIAATDQALSAAYVGMRIQITAGTGVGQYANILTYETGSKVAKITKDSFTNLTVTDSAITGDILTVASTATLYATMPFYLGSDIGGLTANTLYFVESIVDGTTFKVSLTSGGAAEDITANSSGQSVTLYAAGWDHTVAGSTIYNIPDLTSAYIIEPRISYTAPGYTATSRTLNDSAAWQALTYGDSSYVAIAGSGTTANYSADGTTWASAGALATSSTWVDIAYGGGRGAKATAVVGGLGGRGAVLTAVFGVANTTGAATADQIASVTIVNGGQGYTTPPVIVFTPTSGGSGAVATCQVLDGVIVNVTVTIPGSGYAALPTVTAATDRVTHIIVDTWGNDYFSNPQVTLVGGGYSTQATVKAFGSGANDSKLQNAGVKTLLIDNQGAGYTSTPTVQIVDTGARYVAIASGGTGPNCYTTQSGIVAGTAWTAGTDTAKANLTGIAYGNGVWVAVGGTNEAVTSTTGALWTNRTIPTLGAGTYSAIAYGNKTFVAISTGNDKTSVAVDNNGSSWVAGGTLPASTTWTSVAYGNGRFVAIAATGRVAYSIDRGTTWSAAPTAVGTTGSILSSSLTWTNVAYGQGVFTAVANGVVWATSPDGINWTVRSAPSSSNWKSVQFGNINGNPLWVAVSSTSGTVAASARTGAQATGRVKVGSGVVSEVRMLEPGSGYPKGSVSATTVTTNLITVDNTTNLVALQPIEFYGASAGGLIEETTYYVVTGSITSTQFKVATTLANAAAGTAFVLTTSAPSGMTYKAGPTVTLTDPNNLNNVGLRVRLGDGALGNPSFTDRGADNTTATTDVAGDGYSDLFQVSTFVNVYGLSQAPTPGANVEFASIPGVYYKLVTVTNVLESTDFPGTYTATFQINPGMSALLAPRHGDRITTRLKYSQVRLTGHDFLYIGTGGFERTNYPYVDITTANQANQSVYSAGGRVFFTSTDQDGNFNVGNLFGVQQATGTATLNASAFNLSGLNSLQLGSVELGIGSAIITQFSTDPFFTADSDSIVPTQRAIRAYITAQIGGGQSSLNVNTLTSGVVYIAGNSISTTTGAAINITSKMNFTGGIVGAPVALGYFLTR